MQVRDVMTNDPVTVDASASARDAAAKMRERHVGGLPVLSGGVLVGIITDADILKLLETGRISDDLWLPSPLEVIEVPVREFFNWEKTREALSNIGDTPVRDVMSRPVHTVREDDEVEDAAAVMLRHRIARLPVVRGATLVGIVARSDIVAGVAAPSREIT
jgi:CBS domain-containing protein